MSNDTPMQVSLVEQLRSVPSDARHFVEIEPGHHRNIPYGQMCQDAADYIRQLERKLAESCTETQRAKSYKKVLKTENGKLRAENKSLQKRIGICFVCKEEFCHDGNEPFAYCKCGTTEWPFQNLDTQPLAIQVSVLNAKNKQLKTNEMMPRHTNETLRKEPE